MRELEGKVAIVTGGGRGLGRAHALALALEGARVVVNDAGVEVDGRGGDGGSLARGVVEEIESLGGTAIASDLDVADWAAAARLVGLATETFGGLDALVNNAGVLRDRALVNLDEDDFDAVVRVNLKGHVAPTHHAAAYWRERAKRSGPVRAAVVNTVSTSGLVGNPGQSHYGAAKAGVGAFTIIAAQELARYGVRVNAIAPAARSRMTDTVPGLAKMFAPPEEPGVFDPWDPANMSPLVAYLVSDRCEATGRVFSAQGGRIQMFEPWALGGTAEKNGRWTLEELAEAVPRLLRRA